MVQLFTNLPLKRLIKLTFIRLMTWITQTIINEIIFQDAFMSWLWYCNEKWNENENKKYFSSQNRVLNQKSFSLLYFVFVRSEVWMKSAAVKGKKVWNRLFFFGRCWTDQIPFQSKKYLLSNSIITIKFIANKFKSTFLDPNNNFTT